MKIDFEQITKELSYFLGYFWADGYIRKKDNSIILEIATVDSIEIAPIFKKVGDFSFYERKIDNRTDCKRKGNTSIYISCKEFKKFLIENNYQNKSFDTFEKIYNIIPIEFKIIFLRGYIDGDGCIYMNKKNKCYQFSISSCYEQEWTFIEEIMSKMNIKYTVSRRTHNRKGKDDSKSSLIRCSGYSNVVNLLDKIYSSYEEDKIGLSRKYNKYLEIKMLK